jgi:hypothetical protein
MCHSFEVLTDKKLQTAERSSQLNSGLLPKERGVDGVMTAVSPKRHGTKPETEASNAKP